MATERVEGRCAHRVGLFHSKERDKSVAVKDIDEGCQDCVGADVCCKPCQADGDARLAHWRMRAQVSRFLENHTCKSLIPLA